MATPSRVDPVKQFVAILWADDLALGAAIAALQRQWGELDFVGPDHPFDVTNYYEPEMGAGLQRRLVAFEQLVPPESLRHAKPICNQIEDDQARGTRRVVNLDIGYLDHNKIVLGSLKYAGQKIHLGDGVYADLVARYRDGKYRPFEWTFPDFRDGRYDHELGAFRRRYLAQLRERQADLLNRGSGGA